MKSYFSLATFKIHSLSWLSTFSLFLYGSMGLSLVEFVEIFGFVDLQYIFHKI